MPRAAEEWAHAFLFTDCRIPYTSENHGSLLSKERNAMRKDTFAPVPKSLVAGSKEPFCYTQEETHMKPGNQPLEFHVNLPECNKLNEVNNTDC